MEFDVKTSGVESPVWGVDPFGELYRLWNAITEGSQVGIPHVIGRARVVDGKVSGLEMSVTLHGKEEYLSFRDGDDVYFVVPAIPQDGIEGVYFKIHRAIGEAK